MKTFTSLLHFYLALFVHSSESSMEPQTLPPSSSSNATLVPSSVLSSLLVTILDRELPHCSLTLICDEYYYSSEVKDHLLNLPIIKQVVVLHSVNDFQYVQWKKGFCSAYVILLRDLQPILQFGMESEFNWDYEGKYIIVTESAKSLEKFTTSNKGQKTENILGLIPSVQSGKWDAYSNKFYWNSGLRPMRETTTGDNIYFPEKKMKNLDHALLKIVTFQWEPSVFHVKKKYSHNNDYFYGIDIEVIKSLSHVMNFQAKFIEPPPGENWGEQRTNGSWTGLFGKILLKEGDIGIANIFASPERAAAADFSVPYDMQATCFLAGVPPPDPLWRSLFLPFQFIVWIAVCISIFGLGIIICIFIESPRRFVECQLVSIQAHLKIQTTFAPTKWSTKVLLVSIWLYCIILTTAYCSNLTAFLTVFRPPKTYETIQNLKDAKSVSILGVSAFFKFALSSSGDETIHSLANRFEVFDKESEILKEVIQGKGVYLQNENYVSYTLVTKCGRKARIMKECFAPYSIAMALPKNSPLKRRINPIVQRIVHSGLLSKWFSDSLQRSKNEQPNPDKLLSNSKERISEDKRSVTLTMAHLQGGFFILVVVYPLAIVIFLSELAVKKFSKRGQNE